MIKRYPYAYLICILCVFCLQSAESADAENAETVKNKRLRAFKDGRRRGCCVIHLLGNDLFLPSDDDDDDHAIDQYCVEFTSVALML